MYESLLLPWSPPALATATEVTYRAAGLLRTKGTIFLLPPPIPTLIVTYNIPPRPKTRMSSGAVALCKHFERGGASSEHGSVHPYWSLPVGSNERKTEIAGTVLERMLREVVWRNVMLLHPGVAVYEVRNGRGWGMRWTLDLLEEVETGGGQGQGQGQAEKGRNEHGREEEQMDGTADGERKDQNREVEGESIVSSTTNNKMRDPSPEIRSWKIVKTTFRGFVEPIEGMDHELDDI